MLTLKRGTLKKLSYSFSMYNAQRNVFQELLTSQGRCAKEQQKAEL